MVKDSFIFRKDWYLALKNLGDAARLEVYDAIMREVFEDGNSELSLEAKVAMMFITPLIKRDIEKYNLVCERRKLAGSQGGIAKGSKCKQMVANGSKCKQKVASVADNDNDNDNDIQGTNVPMSKEEETNVSKKKPYYPDEFESDWNLYGRKGSKKNGYHRWKDLTEDEKTKMRKHIPYYLQSNDRQYLKDFEGYINQRLFESPVYKGSELLFDPVQLESPSVYSPLTDGILQWWDDKEKCLHFNGYIDMLDDGYTADNRPDGAKVKWQMYSWIWNAKTKEWIKQ